jgi:CRP/FNR family transcriptional regulator
MRVVYGENPFSIDLTRSELASFIGSSRESTTRALNDFQKSGYITLLKKQIHILNEQKLLSLTKNG